MNIKYKHGLGKNNTKPIGVYDENGNIYCYVHLYFFNKYQRFFNIISKDFYRNVVLKKENDKVLVRQAPFKEDKLRKTWNVYLNDDWVTTVKDGTNTKTMQAIFNFKYKNGRYKMYRELFQLRTTIINEDSNETIAYIDREVTSRIQHIKLEEDLTIDPAVLIAIYHTFVLRFDL